MFKLKNLSSIKWENLKTKDDFPIKKFESLTSRPTTLHSKN